MSAEIKLHMQNEFELFHLLFELLYHLWEPTILPRSFHFPLKQRKASSAQGSRETSATMNTNV